MIDTSEAEKLKSEGNNYFKNSAYAKALEFYCAAFQQTEGTSTL